MRLKKLRLNENNIIRQAECEIIKCTNKDIDKKIKYITSNDYVIEYEVENTYKCMIDGDYIFFSLKDSSKNKDLMSFKRSKFDTLCEIEVLDFKNNIMIINIYSFNPGIISNHLQLVVPNEFSINDVEGVEENKLKIIVSSENTYFPYFYNESKLYIFNEKSIIFTNEYGDGVFIVEKILKYNELKTSKNNNEEYTNEDRIKSILLNGKLSLSNGILNLIDENKYTKTQIAKELESYDGYLSIWDTYSKNEGKSILELAREIGKIDKSNNSTYDSSDTKIILNKSIEKIHVGDRLSFSNELPIYLTNKELTWEEYLDFRKEEKIKRKENKIEVIDKTIKQINGKEIIIEGANNISNYKYCFLSIVGSENASKRRLDARNDIKTGEAANPNIGLIIEGKSKIGVKKNDFVSKIEALSPFVLNKVFKNEPTPVQKEAIEIALNTPDIAIIQGPPGTGKTTVITAIIERMNEISNKSKNNKGAILITSFQHDAVINVIERLTVNSLPTMKFGRKEDEDYRSDKIIYDWCDNLEKKIKEKNPNVKDLPETMRLDNLYNEYISFTSISTEKELLSFMKRISFDSNIRLKIEQILENLENEEFSYDEELIALVRSLRTNEKSFADDGRENAKNLYYKLEEFINLNIKENKEIMEYLKVAKSNENITKEFIDKSKLMKKKILNKFIPKPFYKVIKPKSEIKKLYEDIKEKQNTPLDEMELIMYDLLNDIQYNRETIKKSIEEYGYVYASTTQQSMGTEIKAIKNTSKPVYDVVIVDEAARVNPLDLMIPISQAEKKVILVGDHRQLPHIYDDEILDEKKDDPEFKKIVEKSMFEYLKGKAEDLERTDGIKRTITLDRQYRMHPLLGKFVSDNFYSKYEEGFDSPLPESFFKQDLYEKPLVWIDVKHDKGDKQKVGTSWVREVEVEIICKELDKIFKEGKMYDHTNNKNGLKCGVITFYSSQVNAIKKKLIQIDPNLEKKVRVGSVDAFQGMEFDVMYLSLVRTENNSTKINQNRDYYGFLTFENRLCVALSRQKKLLVVVGNSDIFAGKNFENLAKEKIPAMRNLYNLCKSGEGIIIDGESI